MRVALRTAPLLVIGLALIGCNKVPTANGPNQPQPIALIECDKAPTANDPGQPQPIAEKSRTEAAWNLPTVELRIPRMF